MVAAFDFTTELEAKVVQQLKLQRVGYLLGAGSSYLNGSGYPLALELWDLIKTSITDVAKRDDIQAKLDDGATGIEQALDLLDDGGATDTPYRHIVTAALAELFMSKTPPLDLHGEFVRRIAQHADPSVKVFSLNYDPLIERAAAHSRVRLIDGYLGAEHSYFDAAVFEERSGRIRGTGRDKKFDSTVKPIHLLKLHGSLGWYECPIDGVRRGSFGSEPPTGARGPLRPRTNRQPSPSYGRPSRRTPRTATTRPPSSPTPGRQVLPFAPIVAKRNLEQPPNRCPHLANRNSSPAANGPLTAVISRGDLMQQHAHLVAMNTGWSHGVDRGKEIPYTPEKPTSGTL